MRFIFTPVGSGGDVRPFLAVAQRMLALGHTSTVVTAEPFREITERAGVDFVSWWPAAEYEREILKPELWDPRKGMRLVFRILLDNLDQAWNAIASAYEERNSVIVSHALAFASRAFAERHGAPSATMHLQPNVFRTVHDQPIVVPGVDLNKIPRFMRRSLYALVDRFMLDPLIAPRLNAWRAKHGLSPLHRIFDSGVHAPDLVLALFPDWFAPRQPDWPRQARHAGFPIIRNTADVIDPELDAWLSAGEPPVFFTAGTANRHAAAFFDASVDATMRRNGRALLLTAWQDQLPAKLPESIRWMKWVPLSKVLHRSAAYVHHGGIGSCADGFAAGVPQLCMPMAFDQPDNVARLEKLDVGRGLSPRHFTGPRVAQALDELLHDRSVARACEAAATRVAEEDGIANAAAALARLADDHVV